MEPVPGVAVVAHSAPTPEWYRVYLEGLTADRRHVAPRLVERVPEPRMFFSGLRDGEVIASGLSVLDGSVASVQCMATLASARRMGAARAVLAAIEAYARRGGARRLYLQTDVANMPAMTLYASIGFTVAGRYHTRELV
jgi:ribosomal protein S18 acetylase RimI-like enzyme